MVLVVLISHLNDIHLFVHVNVGSYHVFAGKDASRAFGKSSLKQEDAVADYSTLDAEEVNSFICNDNSR